MTNKFFRLRVINPVFCIPEQYKTDNDIFLKKEGYKKTVCVDKRKVRGKKFPSRKNIKKFRKFQEENSSVQRYLLPIKNFEPIFNNKDEPTSLKPLNKKGEKALKKILKENPGKKIKKMKKDKLNEDRKISDFEYILF